ncbi:MAG: AAA family ATPase [Zoogloeaceae bacterium]|jgi:type II secretory pathway predicted ATPase ExeA|nr:AAA family ATPase [Zoogloeaceae bacterium]
MRSVDFKALLGGLGLSIRGFARETGLSVSAAQRLVTREEWPASEASCRVIQDWVSRNQAISEVRRKSVPKTFQTPDAPPKSVLPPLHTLPSRKRQKRPETGPRRKGTWPVGVYPEPLRRAQQKQFEGGEGSHPSPDTAPGNEAGKISAATTQLTEEDIMLLRSQTLFPDTRKHFGLFRDPFAGEIQSHEDVFITPDIRYVREAMFQTARHGGFIAVAGESGSGKSTLRRDLIDRIQRESQPILVIEPYVLGMEDNDQKGKTLKAGHIAEAIMAAIAPLERTKSSPEARFRQVHQALRDSRRAGMRHVLIIEEAHGLPIPTLKHLKRFYELEDGFQKLLSIILIGQSELKLKLAENNHAVREVVQRCELMTLPPLENRLAEFLKFKFERVGKAAAEVIDDSGIEAIRERLVLRPQKRAGGGAADPVSLLYPLAVGNLLTAAMNLAAELGAPRVTADAVKGV